MKKPDFLIPDWPAPANVQAVFTTRADGFSTAPWDSLNLGDHVGDAPAHVAANRAALQESITTRAVFLKQVHGVGVQQLSSATPDGTVADACVTTERGVACTIMVADCLPVLLTNTSGTAVAAAHAGWRGLAGVDARGDLSEKGERMGVLESVFAAFQASNRPLYQSIRAQAAPEIIAWLGPCIGSQAFEVGSEVKAAFVASQPGAAQYFNPASQGKYLADLAGLARARLAALGIMQIYGNDSTAAWCTVANPSRFFSHRRDAGDVGNGGNGFKTTGRMAACIWRV
ncbi:MAG: laccase domain-containing protein [Polaromonas sp.]